MNWMNHKSARAGTEESSTRLTVSLNEQGFERNQTSGHK